MCGIEKPTAFLRSVFSEKARTTPLVLVVQKGNLHTFVRKQIREPQTLRFYVQAGLLTSFLATAPFPVSQCIVRRSGTQ